MSSLRLVLWDQLSHSISSLVDTDKQHDTILMCELKEDATYVKHHKKKLAFLFSAMRHFANELHNANNKVEYIKLDDPQNTGYLKTEVKRILDKFNMDHVIVTHPSDYRIATNISNWEKDLGATVEIRQDDRFLCTQSEFAKWAGGRKQLRMEYFYREMRTKYSILMDKNQPAGGQWNYDSENRKPPKQGLNIPNTFVNEPDEITREVINLIDTHFHDHFGDLAPFHFAVTRDEALLALEMFINQRLINFGNYQDAMLEGEPWMYHSHLSFYINCGLLLPMECIKAAEEAYRQGKAPLNSVEGFIRQILGWREYIRGIYWLKMPQYAEVNFFNATHNLPEFYWTADTKMNCLKQCVLETKQNAYAHHIQRLMVLGNFALLAGINPAEVNEWFLIVYADAYEWVELPNVSGMILFADGGFLASKPYAAGGSYINKMSNYCKNCSYKVAEKNGPNACPFNYLYWDFLSRNRKKLESNQRIRMMFKTYDRMSDSKKQDIYNDSKTLLATILDLN